MLLKSRQNVFIRSLFTFLFLLTCKIFAFNSDSDSVNQNSFNWKVLSFPFKDEISQAILFDSLNGWAISFETKKLYQLNNGKWYLSPESRLYGFISLFGFSQNNLWFSCLDKQRYRYFLRHFNGTEWKNIYPPNSDGIRGLDYITADNIWGACEWGEIIHYNGKEWKLVPSPIFIHFNCMAMVNDTLGWLAGEYRGNGVLFRWDGKEWNLMKRFKKREITSTIMVNSSTGWAFLSQKNDITGILFKNEQLSDVKFSSLIEDTIYVNLPDIDRPIFYYPKASAVTSFRISFITKENGKREILVSTKKRGSTGNFYWLTSDGKVYLIKRKKSKRFKNLSRIIQISKSNFTNEYGVAFADFDNDGDEDIYSINAEGGNRLLLFGGNSRIKTIMKKSFIEAAIRLNILGRYRTDSGDYIYDMGATVADMDNDGDNDLYIACLYGKNQLYENINGRRFWEIGRRVGVCCGNARSNVGIWGDIDNDGDLDLFVTNEDTTNMLFLNDGVGQFEEITHQAGLTSLGSGKCATFGDIDQDGDLDLVVPYFCLPNRIYRNKGIHPQTGLPYFEDVTEQCLPSGLDSIAKSTSACLADFDNDGDLDLYITNLVFTNRLFENDGTGKFKDITRSAGLIDSSMSHSCSFFDIDNDGDLDLFVTNRGRNLFYRNVGNKKFIRDTTMFNREEVAYSTGMACGDPDNDGDIDFYVANNDQLSKYYKNLLNNNAFIKIKLIGTKSCRNAIGAKAFLYPAGHLDEKEYLLGLREVNGGSGYGCMNSTSIHYGIEPNKKYDLKIWFPSGIEIVKKNIPAGRILIIEEQSGWAKLSSLGRRMITHYLKERFYQLEYLKFFTLLILFISLAIILARKEKIASQNKIYLIGIPFIFYSIFIGITFKRGGFWTAHFIPILLAIFSFVVVYLLLKKQLTNKIRLHLAEELLISCRAFDHGNWASSYLNQLQLFSTNLIVKQKISDSVAEKLQECILGFYEMVYQPIENISQLAVDSNIRVTQANELGRQLLLLSQNLNKIKIAMIIKKQIKAETWKNVYRLIDGMKLNIADINENVIRFFSCNPISVIRKTVAFFQRQVNYPISIFDKNISGKELLVCIKSAELTAIIDNLLQNADQALNPKRDPRVTIRFKINNYFLLIEISDNGQGIPRKLWEKIFDQNYSSKTGRNGGFGLYYCRLTLEKYGGNIEVVKSGINKGTTFLLKLKIL